MERGKIVEHFTIFIIILLSCGAACSQNIKSINNKIYCLSNSFKEKDEETKEIVETLYAHYSWEYPKIYKMNSDTLLISNPIIYENDEIAEMFKNNQTVNNAPHFIRKVMIPRWEIIKYFNREDIYRERKDVIKQLNFFDKELFVLYKQDSNLFLIQYDTLTKSLNSLARFPDWLDISSYHFQFKREENTLVFFDGGRSIVYDRVGRKSFNIRNFNLGYMNLLGAHGDYFYLINTSSYCLYAVNFKKIQMTKIGNLQFQKRKVTDDTISFFMDEDNSCIYITFFDLTTLCLIAYEYKINLL